MQVENTHTHSATMEAPVKAPKRSKSWLSKMRLGLHPKRTSTETLPECVEDCHSDSSSTAMEGNSTRAPGGCLKIPTQAQSLLEQYESPVGSSIEHSVRFGELQVLVFDLTLGDNPSVTVGPPLAMGTRLCATLSLSVEAYEESRPARRSHHQLAVPKTIREDWLRDEGFSRGECRQVELEILAIKKSRKSSSCAMANIFQIKLFGDNKKKNKRTSVLRN